MTKLADANTSREIELSQYFRKWTDKKDLLVLVEGDDDIPFWTSMFRNVSNRYARIDINTLKVKGTDTMSEKEKNGKNILMKVSNLGPNKVVAVDMDYDGIVPGYHDYSQRLTDDKYVLHTTYYSIENHKLFPNIMAMYANDVTKEEVGYDFQDLLNRFSKSVYPFLLLLIVYERRRVIGGSHEGNANEICIDALLQDISTLTFHIGHEAEELEKWSMALSAKYDTLLKRYETDICVLKEELAGKDISEENCWTLLQGHSLANYFLRVLERISRETIRKKEEAIRQDLTITNKQEAIETYHRSLNFARQNLSEEIRYTFIEHPHISDADPGIKDINTQIEGIL